MIMDVEPGAEQSDHHAAAVWRLRAGDEPAGDLVVEDSDFPWLRGSFRPAPAFEGVRALFAEELRLLDDIDDDGTAWDDAYGKVESAVTLIAPDGRPVPEFLLHIDGTTAWWRWSDEPFDG